MKSPTYYDILGVSRDASLEEITAAKNALAKVYHPDANVHKDIDTTAFMQDILEAYHVLSDEKKRKEYNRETFGESTRVFKTFTVGPEGDSNDSSFVTYWNAASQLNETIDKSVRLMERESKKKSIPQRIIKKIGKNQHHEESFRNRQISRLSRYSLKSSKQADIFTDFFSLFMKSCSLSGISISILRISSTVSLNLAGWAVSRKIPVSPGAMLSASP